MREDGYTATAIAVEFDMALSTVCKWLKGEGTTRPAVCEECGVPISHPEHRGRPRRFCSSRCRRASARVRLAA